MPIRLGFVGLSKNGGWAADALAPPILTGPLADKYALTAVSTSSSASASATSAHYTELAGREVKGYHGSTESISADPDVDLVVVSVKVYEHLAAIIPAVKAGKDLFVEWPLGKNLDEAKAIVRAIKERGVQRTMIGIQDWNIPAFMKVKQWVDAGKIGRVISTSYYGTVVPELAFKGPTLLSKYKYITEPDLGGTFIDIPVAHVLAGVTHALGKLQKVSATTAIGFKEIKLVDAVGSAEGETISAKVPDQFAISGILESGALLSATFSALGASNPPGQPTMVWEVIGTEGKIRMESEGYLTSLAPAIQPPEVVYLNSERFDLKEENAAATPVARAWDAFANGNQANFPTFDDALELHKLVEAIKTSDREGRIVRVDEIQ